MGVNEGSVEYWKRAAVVEPFALTVALSVAPVVEIEAAAPVATVGGTTLLSSIFLSSDSMVKYAAANPPLTAPRPLEVRTRFSRRLGFRGREAKGEAGSVGLLSHSGLLWCRTRAP